MSTKKEELVAIAREGGYDGAMPGTTAEAIKVAAGYVGGGGGGGIVAIDFTAQEGSQTYYDADATYSEIFDAVDSGNLVVARVYMPGGDGHAHNDWITLPLTYAEGPMPDGSTFALSFSATATLVPGMPPMNFSLFARSVDGPVTGQLIGQQLQLNS